MLVLALSSGGAPDECGEAGGVLFPGRTSGTEVPVNASVDVEQQPSTKGPSHRDFSIRPALAARGNDQLTLACGLCICTLLCRALGPAYQHIVLPPRYMVRTLHIVKLLIQLHPTMMIHEGSS